MTCRSSDLETVLRRALSQAPLVLCPPAALGLKVARAVALSLVGMLLWACEDGGCRRNSDCPIGSRCKLGMCQVEAGDAGFDAGIPGEDGAVTDGTAMRDASSPSEAATEQPVMTSNESTGSGTGAGDDVMDAAGPSGPQGDAQADPDADAG